MKIHSIMEPQTGVGWEGPWRSSPSNTHILQSCYSQHLGEVSQNRNFRASAAVQNSQHCSVPHLRVPCSPDPSLLIPLPTELVVYR